MVVGGWLPATGSAGAAVGALLVGAYDGAGTLRLTSGFHRDAVQPNPEELLNLSAWTLFVQIRLSGSLLESRHHLCNQKLSYRLRFGRMTP